MNQSPPLVPGPRIDLVLRRWMRGLGERVEHALSHAPLTAVWFWTSRIAPLASVVALVVATQHPRSRALWIVAVVLLLLAGIVGTATGNTLGRLSDPLTGLRNRHGLLELADSNLKRMARRRGPGAAGATALVLLDLEGFRALNDSLGTSTGDQVLKETGQRLNRWFRETVPAPQGLRRRFRIAEERGTVARLGDDEFAVLIHHVTDPSALEQTVRGLLDELSSPYSQDAWPALALEVNAGLSYHPDDADNADALLSRADIALRHAQCRRSGFEVYDSEHDAVHSAERLGLLTELRRAMRCKELRLHYQPIVDFTGRTTALEALLRWDCAGRGPVPPNDFVPLAEASALAPDLADYVLDAAVRQATHWWRRGIYLPVAVNVSARDLTQDGFAAATLARLTRNGLPAHALELEITERLLIDDWQPAVSTLDELRREGVRISLDDFGTGYSSLVRLRSLPIDTLKLDHWFVARLAADEDDAAVVRCSVELAHLLGMRVVAEGVEDQFIWQRLRAMGVDAAQGWYISAALPPDRVPSWLQDHEAAAPARTRTRMPSLPSMPQPRTREPLPPA